MNLLIVDDQQLVIDSLKSGVDWKKLQISNLYTACSGKEARLILANFDINIMLTDIEMPEENGLELFHWVKGEYPNIECIFLTSHADFDYAKEAIGLGGFDYILQPVKPEEIERVVSKLRNKILEHRKAKKLADTRKLVVDQRDIIMDSMIAKLLQKDTEDVENTFKYYKKLVQLDFNHPIFRPIIIQIVEWNNEKKGWDDNLIMLIFRNVLEEVFRENKGKISLTYHPEVGYCILLITEEGITEDLWEDGIRQMYDFIDKHMEFSLALFSGKIIENNFSTSIYEVINRVKQNASMKKGVCFEETYEHDNGGLGEEENYIVKSIEYIKKNINKNITRSEVAGLLHLNEEYFSRLFKMRTGYTFKSYVLMEKVKEAKRLLKHSRLSVSIIASKVGYTNFSYFSKLFKKMTNATPQEYRKKYQKENK